jgi:hypothetical protein
MALKENTLTISKYSNLKKMNDSLIKKRQLSLKSFGSTKKNSSFREELILANILITMTALFYRQQLTKSSVLLSRKVIHYPKIAIDIDRLKLI